MKSLTYLSAIPQTTLLDYMKQIQRLYVLQRQKLASLTLLLQVLCVSIAQRLQAAIVLTPVLPYSSRSFHCLEGQVVVGAR